MDNRILFEVPYTLEIDAYHDEDLSDPDAGFPPYYRRNFLLGYKKGVDDFLEIFWVFKNEMGSTVPISTGYEVSFFNKILNRLSGGFLSDFKKNRDMESVLNDYIEDLEQFKFRTFRPKEPYKKHTGNMADLKKVEITTDFIARMIFELRQRRVEFYETLLQEYIGRKKDYDEGLRKRLEKGGNINLTDENREILNLNSNENILDSTNYKDEEIFSLDTYVFHITSYLLKEFEDPSAEGYEYVANLSDEITSSNVYRFNIIWGYKKGIDDIFEIFKIFKEEMSFIIDSEEKSLFENVLTVLLQFLEKFKVESSSNLEQLLVDYIEDLEKYMFFHLRKMNCETAFLV